MTFLDATSPAASAGLDPAVEDLETGTGELLGIGFDREAIDRNYWDLRRRRHEDRKFTIMGDISESLYGDRRAWEGTQGEGTPDVEGQTEKLFRDLEARRGVEPGRLANFPESFAALDAQALEQIRTEMQEERSDLDRRAENRSSPSIAGGVADFVGMAGAAVTDIEGLSTLPFGAGAGSLGRTMVIEGLVGAGSEAIAIPAYNQQAQFLDRDAPDPLQLLLFGATFGAALPLAGRGIKEGGQLAAKGAEVTNRKLLELAGKGSDKTRGAAAQLAREEAALDSAPAGVSPDQHAADLDAAEIALESGDPVVVRPDDIDVGVEGQPIAQRLMADLQEELGLTPDQAAGIVGNLAHESGGFRSLQEIAPLVPGSRGGFGYAQWTADRRVNFENWSAERGLDPRSYKANLGFLLHELQNTPEGAVLDRLRGARNAAEATQIFSETFLRPGIPHMSSRLDWAQRALGGDIVTVQGPLRNREGVLRASFDVANLKADDVGFEIEVGEIRFSQRWATSAATSDPAGAASRVADDIAAEQLSARGDLDAQRAADIETARNERQVIQTQIDALKSELKDTPGQAAKSRVRAQIKERDAELQAVTTRLDEQLDLENRAGEVAIEREIADLQSQLKQTQGKSAKAKVRKQINAAKVRLEDERAARIPAVPAPAVGAAPGRAAARGASSQGLTAIEAPTNQPPEGYAAPQPELFDDPVNSTGSVAQLELIDAALRARLATGPEGDIEIALGKGEDGGTARLSEILNDHDEEADFLEQLNVCMPKGVSNG